MTDGIELVFETHSLTVDNERGIATGWLGGALSDGGRSLAVELGARRRDDAIDIVLCSDLARAAYATLTGVKSRRRPSQRPGSRPGAS